MWGAVIWRRMGRRRVGGLNTSATRGCPRLVLPASSVLPSRGAAGRGTGGVGPRRGRRQGRPPSPSPSPSPAPHQPGISQGRYQHPGDVLPVWDGGRRGEGRRRGGRGEKTQDAARDGGGAQHQPHDVPVQARLGLLRPLHARGRGGGGGCGCGGGAAEATRAPWPRAGATPCTPRSITPRGGTGPDRATGPRSICSTRSMQRVPRPPSSSP